MSSQPDPVPHPWRRFLRFSVRGLIVVVLVVGAWLGRVVHQAHVQRNAVAAIKNAGGSVLYDWECTNGTYPPGGKPWAPNWLVDLIGVDYFGQVDHVDLSVSSIPSDHLIVQVGRLTRLKSLVLSGPCITDAELAYLKGLTSLEHLVLNNTQVSDAGVNDLMRGLPSLTVHHLFDSRSAGR
jgi:hypothetical protein